jgi:hypothetical protein
MMIHIPPEVQIRASIQPGSVYYFKEESFSSTEPHFFIVLNHSPAVDSNLLLVCSSSQHEKVKRRRRYLPTETLVEIGKEKYAGFTTDSIVDCNTLIKMEIGDLISKLSRGVLKLKQEMNSAIINILREGVQASPMVAGEDKELLNPLTVRDVQRTS